MNRLQKLFAEKDQNILNIYFTAGFPKLEDTASIIQYLAAAGADLIEVGMPYSDPLADGPTIQQSGQKAIENGMTLEVLFQQIKQVRSTTEIPLVLMGYFNQVMQYGEQRFINACASAGIDGLILPDLPVHEYETFYKTAIEAANLKVSFLITPQTSEARIQKIDDLSSSFIYMVSNASITGAKKEISEQQIAYFERINQMQLNNPRLIGFGISNYETFSTACRYAKGAIIGSAFIRMLEKSDDIEQDIHQFVRDIRQTDGGR
ncbi:MAG: tryptophan synthase subunit alpha [Bacteroidota bacterium]